MSEEDKQYSTCCYGVQKPKQSKQQPQTTLKISKPTEGKRLRSNEKTKPPGHMEAKVILLGNSGVGKSSIAHRYCKDMFTEAHDVTIGGAYMQQTVTLPYGT